MEKENTKFLKRKREQAVHLVLVPGKSFSSCLLGNLQVLLDKPGHNNYHTYYESWESLIKKSDGIGSDKAIIFNQIRGIELK